MHGTAFDVFGGTTERRAERQLIAEYLATAVELAQSLSADKLDPAAAQASPPDNIRSFGHVKEVIMQKTAQRRTALRARYRRGAQSAAAWLRMHQTGFLWRARPAWRWWGARRRDAFGRVALHPCQATALTTLPRRPGPYGPTFLEH
ncbi:DUF6537 domain-containing protein [Cupriavidus sp. BIC8F]|uniref:DUF6537 domain-containing protein n=1 Tax=Cupriavidus sp. BIC8F TaxID=3079014 RepID=UPI003966E9D8